MLCNARRLFVCLSVCLPVSSFTLKLLNGSLRKFYDKCIRGQGRIDKISQVIRLREFSEGSFNNNCKIGYFSTLWLISPESDWIFMKILSQMYPCSRKSPLNFGGKADPESRSRYGLQIMTIFTLADVCGHWLLLLALSWTWTVCVLVHLFVLCQWAKINVNRSNPVVLVSTSRGL